MSEAEKQGRDDAMAEMYRSGASLRDVAKRSGITMQRVHQILGKRSDVALREPYRRTTKRPFTWAPSLSRVNGRGE